MTLRLLNSTALWWALLAVPIVLLHLWRSRPRRLPVAAGFLWAQVLQREGGRSRWQSPSGEWSWRRLASLALDLGVLAPVVFAMAEATLIFPNESQVPIATIPRNPDADVEVAVAEISLPVEAREGEAFTAEVVLRSNHVDERIVELSCASKPVAQKPVHVVRGENRVRLTASAVGSGKTVVEATIRGFKNRLAENDSLAGSMLVVGRPRVLVLETKPAAAAPVVQTLGLTQFQIERRQPEHLPGTKAEWETFAVVILCNVPAAEGPSHRGMTPSQMEAIRDYVAGGGGLITIGGDEAFTAGGYHGNALEEALPVVSVPREVKRPGVAMVLVVDRSGSMGFLEGKPLAMAKEAMRQTVEMLEPQDQIGVLAFSDTPAWISELHPLADKDQVKKKIAAVTAGGGTYMGPAIEQAYLALRDAPAKRKHMIVLTDGVSEPANFEGLARIIAAAQIKMSTVALGKEPDRDLLRKLAQIGGGEFYACDDPEHIPGIFKRETEQATRPGICEKTTQPRVGPSPLLGKLDLSAVPELAGYVETLPKPTSTVLLDSGEEDPRPLLALRRFVRGMSIAFLSDAGGRWAAKWLSWPGFKPLWAQLARQAVRPIDSTPRTWGGARSTPPSRVPPPILGLPPVVPSPPPTMPLAYYLLAAAAVILVLDIAVRRSET